MKAGAAREKPIVGVLLGDPSGIGPELVVKLLARADNVVRAHVALLADPNVLTLGEKAAGVALDARRASGIDALAFDAGRPTLVAFDWIAPRAIEVGQATVASGRTVLSSLEVAADAVRTGAIDAVLFAPFNKHAMRIAGLQHEDEMRLLQHTLGVSDFVTEFNITGDLWTSRVTSHIPLAAVASAITQDGVRNAVRIIDKNLRASGVARPRIAVAGLNPHAGDGGSFGREEIDIIEPAVRSLAADGLDARGPFPADTVFVAARRGDFDAVVTMYHDQGQIAMKLMGFDRGVTLLGGLPVPVATCASGSAFDIAGKGIANVEGLQQAFDLVVRMSSAQNPLS
ncbi:MAG TPA: 4-hydroxythreonine-4-phosphate dehydrogenase PdxA [Casimicrobiaceae bacterium]|nr:4-hydroxythreonine-4-phosphate dehydrogenase PdxA [Casimicrobiaceae bacterium]